MCSKLKRVFRVVDLNVSVEEQQESRKRCLEIDWSRCVVCQKDRDEPLIDPSQNKRETKFEGIETLSRNLKLFQKYGNIPRDADVELLDSGDGIECNLMKNEAKYHKSCFLLCSNSKLKRLKTEAESENTVPQVLTRKSSSFNEPRSDCASANKPFCLFCLAPEGRNAPLRRLNVDGAKTIRACALKRGDSRILVATDSWQGISGVWYHNNHYSAYVRESKPATDKKVECDEVRTDVLQSVIQHIKDAKEASEELPVFVMSDLARLYAKKLEEQGIKTIVHSSRLKEKLLSECTLLESSGSAGQSHLVTFKKDLDASLRANCSKSFSEHSILDEAADALRDAIFNHSSVNWEEMSPETVEASTPFLLQYFVKRLIDGKGDSGVKDNVVSTISQLIFFHSRKGARSKGTVRRHDASRETPLPVYSAAKLYGATRSKELIETFYDLGLSISYDRLKNILTERANKACSQYKQDGVVCPVRLQKGVFTTAAVDNLDHNPSSTTSRSAFHGTAISLSQHGPAGEDRSLIASENSKRKVMGLPPSYTVVPTSYLDGKAAKCPSSALSSIDQLTTDPYQEEHDWLEACREVSTADTWPAFHSKTINDEVTDVTRTAVLPVFNAQSQSMSMMVHSMDVVQKATNLLNPSQTPVLVGDLPLYALCKQIQWLCPEKFGEDKFFVLMGGMHVEKAVMALLGDLLEGSGWSTALVNAGITTKGRADSMISASHITRTRYAHQVTAAVLHKLKRKAFEESAVDDPVTFEQWCEGKSSTPQFKFWDMVFKLELSLLQLVRSTRTGDLSLYTQSLSRVLPFFFALDHQNYARWLSVHVRDLLNLPSQHPDLWREFQEKHFVATKSKRSFSRMALDQAHEQVNAILKGNGGMIGLTESPSQLLKWMLFSPEVTEIVDKFEKNVFNPCIDDIESHHFDSEAARQLFRKDLKALEEFFEEAGNPFSEESQDLYNIDTRRCCSEEAKACVMNIEEMGRNQYIQYSQDRLARGVVPIHEPIKQNKLAIFSSPVKHSSKSKVQGQIRALKSESAMFGRLYVAISNNRPGDLDEFFSHESHQYPPALFCNDGKMRTTTKADLLNHCLAPLAVTKPDKCPAVTAKILDGAAVIHMLKPGLSVLFSDFIHDVFLPFVMKESECVLRLDVVWDVYIQNSLKAMTREKRGDGSKIRVATDTKIPQNWLEFFRNSENKTTLFKLLADSISNCKTQHSCKLFSTSGTQVVTNSQANVRRVAPCNHEEADTRIFVHLADVVRNGHSKVLIRSADTDVVALAVSGAARLPRLEELWIHIGIGKQHRYIAAHEIKESLGPRMSRVLPVFHAMTGTDNNPAFYGIGKKSWWKTLALHQEVLPALEKLGKGITDEDVLREIERFVIAAYSPSRQFQSITECRRIMFASSNRGLDSIPPTQDALHLNLRRSSYQAQVWDQLLTPMQNLPSPSDWGWEMGSDGWSHNFRTKPLALDACKSTLVHCNCKVACKGNCSCKAIGCCDLCGCKCMKVQNN